MSLGALAMALVILRGAICGEFPDHVAIEAIAALAVFSFFGAVAGWIADYVIRDAMEDAFRRRVEWYRQGIMDAESLNDNPTENS